MLLAGVVAFGAQAEDFEGNLYIQDATIARGQTTTLSVQVDNNIPFRGFQFDFYLPEGVTLVGYEMNSERWPEGSTEIGDIGKTEDGTGYRFAMTPKDNVYFTGTSGEIATITIKADETVAEGEHAVGLKNIYIFDMEGATIYNKEVDRFTLSVVASIPFEGTLYIEDATIFPGQTTTLSVQVENNIPFRGFQFDFYLPEGVTVVGYEMNSERWPEGSIEIGDIGTTEDGTGYRFAMTPKDNVYFTGTSGEIATITIKADETVAEGEHAVGLKNIYIFDMEGATIYDKEEDQFTLAVKSFNAGYAVKVLPFALNEEEVEVPILLDNLTDITNIEFDLILPTVFVTEELYFTTNVLGRTKFTLSEDVIADGTVHVNIDRKSSNKVNAGEENEILDLGLAYDPDLISTGVSPITFKNIVLTDVGNNTYLAAPYTTEIFSGDSPKATVTDGVVAFHGDYGETEGFELLKASLPEGATIDLTEVSDLAEDPSELRTDNVIVTAEAISYGRAMTNEWGSLCLPFALESDDNIQLYELTSASSSAMTFDPVSSVEANTPVVFKASGDGFTVKAANDGFDTGFAAAMPKTSIEAITDWVLNGSYSEETIDVSGMQAYGLMNNEFHRFTKTLTAGAFRAWLQNNGEPMNATIRIEDSTEGISIIEQEDGSVKLIFDMQGRQLNDCPSHQIFIENGHKVVRTK